MVRTKADRVPTKAVGGKAPQKLAKSTPTKKVTTGSKGKSYSGGNPSHPRETPEWQKPITFFISQNPLQKSANSSELQDSSGEGSCSQGTKYESD